MTILRLSLLAVALLIPAGFSRAAQEPAMRDLAYGEHTLQKLDVYLPEGDGPFPIMLHIHGGGWWNGDKKWQNNAEVVRVLKGGVAYLPINYRFIPQGREAGIFPPVLAPFEDAARALQFVRLHAEELKLDPARVVVTGGSAGACSALWLSLSPEMARPDSADPVERQSTRVLAVGGTGAQTSLDPRQMREWVGPELAYGGHAFGLAEKKFDEFLGRRGEFEKYFPRVSPAALLDRDDPPVFLNYGGRGLDKPQNDPNYHVHSPHFGVGFQKLAHSLGATCYVQYKDAPPTGFDGDHLDFLVGVATGKFTGRR